jgi:hypothetical protein
MKRLSSTLTILAFALFLLPAGAQVLCPQGSLGRAPLKRGR